MRILIVEDEPNLLAILEKRLRSEGYSVDACNNGEDGKSYIEATAYDVVILDIMLPKIDGLTILKEMRAVENKTPVLLLTAKDSTADRVRGLDSGADDYLVKPFSFDELLARLRVLTRRKYNNVSSALEIADLSIDSVSRTVMRGGIAINLSSKEFAILEYLMQNKGTVLSRKNLEEHIWSYDYEGASNVVDVYIRYLRKKVDDGFAIKLIQTVRGYGYVLKEQA
ncbi:MAG: response regulator transcription factor [Clostridia bacterium]